MPDDCPPLKTDRDAILADLARAWYQAEVTASNWQHPTMEQLRAADRVAQEKRGALWEALTKDAER